VYVLPRTGKGICRFPGGQEYEGTYKNGLREGRGTVTFAEGAVYEGRFKVQSAVRICGICVNCRTVRLCTLKPCVWGVELCSSPCVAERGSCRLHMCVDPLFAQLSRRVCLCWLYCVLYDAHGAQHANVCAALTSCVLLCCAFWVSVLYV
jgi:hypothetical protein